jgi:adenylate cyclase
MADKPDNPSVSRRLAAILAADIAGYSALMSADEEATVRELKAHQAAIIPMVSEHGGRVIDTAGDGILAEFSSVVSAVECAVGIQKTMAERNATVDPARRMQFRMGVNLGDIIHDGTRVFGDGVNIAARLEAMAEPGGICLSGETYGQVRGRLKLVANDLGEKQLKNIAHPVRVYRVSTEHISAPQAPTTTILSLPSKPSIAVLPFTNLVGDPKEDNFSDGIAEDIITELSRFSELTVIARNSSFQYKGRSPDIRHVGSQLAARYVLEGSVQRAGKRIRITAQLIDATTGAHCWAERYDRELNDAFAIQDELAYTIASILASQIKNAEIARTLLKHPQQPDILSPAPSISGTDMHRQLAAVLFADVAGYSRLMDTYEDETHPRMMALFGAVIEPTIAKEGGRIVRTQGDSFLACFASVNNAIDAATSIQQEVTRREADIPRPKRIAFRMGLHTGDIVVEATDIYGAGVNLAARLQELAEPGNLLISGAVYDQLGGNLRLPTLDLGFLRLKNISHAIRVIKVETSPGREPLLPTVSNPSPHSRPSIAVLPFVEYGISPDQSYFGDGLVEDVAGALASLPDVFVISRSSTLKYRQSPPDIAAIANELGVRYVLWGSVRRRSDRLRITAELADAETKEVVEQHVVEENNSDLFSLQDRLVERVLQKITPNVRDTELRRIRRKRPDSLDAYDYFLRGLDLLYRPNVSQFGLARQMFLQSIMLDDNYAAPHALIALWHSIRIGQGWSVDRTSDRMRVEEFSSAALSRDPNDVWALALSGHVRALLFRDFDTAFDLFDRALRTSPNSAFAWSRSSPAFSYIGNAVEARRRAEQALRLSPFDPDIFFIHCALGLAAYTEADYASAVAWGRRCYAGNPTYTANLRLLAASLAANGQEEEARSIGESLRLLEPDFRVRTFTNTYAFRDKQLRDRLADHLLLAGLPNS